jgi:hypothetical protein
VTVTDILKDHFYCHFTQTPLRLLDSEAADTMISQNTGNCLLLTHNTTPHPSTPESLVTSLLLGRQSECKDQTLSFNRTQSRIMICLLTGHNTMRGHLHFMGQTNSPLCRRCGAEDETSAHILHECEALASLRHVYQASLFSDIEDIKSLSLGAIWNFHKGTGLH